MAWYLVCFILGIVVGLIIEEKIGSDVTYNGKVKQKGENNRILITKIPSERKTTRKEKRIKKRGLKRQKQP